MSTLILHRCLSLILQLSSSDIEQYSNCLFYTTGWPKKTVYEIVLNQKESLVHLHPYIIRIYSLHVHSMALDRTKCVKHVPLVVHVLSHVLRVWVFQAERTLTN